MLIIHIVKTPCGQYCKEEKNLFQNLCFLFQRNLPAEAEAKVTLHEKIMLLIYLFTS